MVTLTTAGYCPNEENLISFDKFSKITVPMTIFVVLMEYTKTMKIIIGINLL